MRSVHAWVDHNTRAVCKNMVVIIMVIDVHISGSTFFWFNVGLPEQAIGGFPIYM